MNIYSLEEDLQYRWTSTVQKKIYRTDEHLQFCVSLAEVKRIFDLFVRYFSLNTNYALWTTDEDHMEEKPDKKT
jgi:hypothetical protein